MYWTDCPEVEDGKTPAQINAIRKRLSSQN